jgi:PST family polysaccharide transporter
LTLSYDESSGESGSRSVKWNSVGLAGRQVLIVLFSLILARILGPENLGVVAQATVYTTLTSLILDQGISASLLSRKAVDRQLLGAAITINVLLALALAAVTLPLARPFADFLGTPELEGVLPVLAAGLVLKGVQVVPRMLLMRRFKFRALAFSEITSALIGGVLGTVLAIAGWGYWALVAQLIVSDLILALALYWSARPPLPNLHVRRLRELIGFSSRVFVSNFLGFSTRNADTILVAKFLGSSEVGLYSLAYRVLSLPVQMIGQMVTRVIFPVISRDREDPWRASATLLRSSRAIAFLAFPLMAFVAVASFDAISVFLGPAWIAAVPTVIVLAITGARQAVTSLNTPTMLGFGRADLQLRFMIITTILQVGGMVAGLPFGIAGVATGYAVAGFVITPWIFSIQRSLAGTPIRRQLGVLIAPANASFWAAAVYALFYLAPVSSIVRLPVGGVTGAIVFVACLWVFHRRGAAEAWSDALSILRSRPPKEGGGQSGQT